MPKLLSDFSLILVMGPDTPPFLPSPETEEVGEAAGGALVLKEVMA